MKHHYTVRIFSFLAIFSMLFSAVGMPTQNVLAAPKDTALQFDGTDDHVTFGDTRMTSGTLSGTTTPTWNTQANSQLGASSLTFNGSTAYVTFGAAPLLNATNFTLETWFYWTGAGATTSTGTGGLVCCHPPCHKGSRRIGDNWPECKLFPWYYQGASLQLILKHMQAEQTIQ